MKWGIGGKTRGGEEQYAVWDSRVVGCKYKLSNCKLEKSFDDADQSIDPITNVRCPSAI